MLKYYNVSYEHPNPFIAELCAKGNLIFHHDGDINDPFNYSVILRSLNRKQTESQAGDLTPIAYDLLKTYIPAKLACNSCLFIIPVRETPYKAHQIHDALQLLEEADIIQRTGKKSGTYNQYWMNPVWLFFGNIREYIVHGLS